MADPHPIPRHPAFKNLTGLLLPSGIHVAHFLGRKQWLAVCACGREFTAGGAGLLNGGIARCAECRFPSVKPNTKKCRECKRVLPFTAEHFQASRYHPFGLRAKCRACINAVARVEAVEYAREVRWQVLQHYSGRLFPACICCGEGILEFLTIDHVDGGGSRHRKTPGRTTNIYQRLKADGFPGGFRTLCMNCNFSLGKSGYCPHGLKGPPAWHKERTAALCIPATISGPSQECFKCSRIFPLTAEFFYRHPMMSSGFLGKCIDCAKTDIYRDGAAKRLARRIEVLSHYSSGDPRCQCCEESHIEFLSIDHVNNDGAEHRRQLGARNLYVWLKRSKFPVGFAVLCMSCNCAKGLYKSCPHSR